MHTCTHAYTQTQTTPQWLHPAARPQSYMDTDTDLDTDTDNTAMAAPCCTPPVRRRAVFNRHDVKVTHEKGRPLRFPRVSLGRW